MAAANIVKVTDADFDTAVQGPGLVVVDFWAEWCVPCKAIAPVLEELAADYDGRLKVVKVDVDRSPQTAARFAVLSVPTVLLFHRGEVKDQAIGLVAKRVLTGMVDKVL